MSSFTVKKNFPVVNTDKGKLRGFLSDGIFTFYGVRYARAERFHQPEEIPSWEGIQDAQAYGYISPILANPRPTSELRIPHGFWPDSENCQYLNIWTKSIDENAKKPVIVWYHGGGYANGSSIEQICYDGHSLADHEDVVVVTVNHRLNVFGYLDLSDFGPEYENSGNAGFADLVYSLKWVQKNIAGFGGDPDNVTIMGQSGGGGKVNTLGQIPEAAGLFHKAILLSGGMGGIRFSANPCPPKYLAEKIMEECGVSTVQELEKVPTRLFIRGVNLAGKKIEAEGYTVFWGPKVNNYYLGNPAEVGFSEYFRTVPTLGGTVFSDLVRAKFDKDKDEYTDEEARALVAEKYGEENADAVIAEYKKVYPDKLVAEIPELDVNVRTGARNYLLQKAKESSAPVYNMLLTLDFDYEGSTPAWHCADLPLIFRNVDMIPLYRGMGEVTDKLQKQMSGAIAQFARTGDPNVECLPKWAPVTPDAFNTMVLDRECKCVTDFDTKLCEEIQGTGKAPRFGGMSAFGDEDAANKREWMY
ncbi:MAG: carboxylesterase/lipase family protein [Solobacterium sp.]|nr:carboxylesterase/lipase family protein [Solobacterium sp.]